MPQTVVDEETGNEYEFPDDFPKEKFAEVIRQHKTPAPAKSFQAVPPPTPNENRDDKLLGPKPITPLAARPDEEPDPQIAKPAVGAPSQDEAGFQSWYKANAQKTGLNPNPDAPEHHYDYRAAFRAGVQGPDETGHWPSEFKADDHPNRFIPQPGGATLDSKSGRVITASEQAGFRPSPPSYGPGSVAEKAKARLGELLRQQNREKEQPRSLEELGNAASRPLFAGAADSISRNAPVIARDVAESPIAKAVAPIIPGGRAALQAAPLIGDIAGRGAETGLEPGLKAAEGAYDQAIQSPQAQALLRNIPDPVAQAVIPQAGKIATGAARVATGATEALASQITPANVGIIAGAAGLPGVAGRALSAYFAGKMGYDLAKNEIPAAAEAIAAGNYEEAEKLVGGAAVSTVMTAMAAAHAAGAKEGAARASEPKAEPVSESTPQPTEPTAVTPETKQASTPIFVPPGETPPPEASNLAMADTGKGMVFYDPETMTKRQAVESVVAELNRQINAPPDEPAPQPAPVPPIPGAEAPPEPPPLVPVPEEALRGGPARGRYEIRQPGTEPIYERRGMVEPPEEIPDGEDRRIAERRAAIAKEVNLPEGHPAVRRVLESETSKTAGIQNRNAFDIAEAQGEAGAYAMSDSDGLKALNDTHGYAAGDAMLAAKARAAQQAGLEVYHDKGDEFLYRGKDAESLRTGLETARGILKKSRIAVDYPDGTTKIFTGADFSFGVGENVNGSKNAIAAAERALHEHKAAREAAGERARGELRGIREVAPEGEQGEIRAGPEPEATRVLPSGAPPAEAPPRGTPAGTERERGPAPERIAPAEEVPGVAEAPNDRQDQRRIQGDLGVGQEPVEARPVARGGEEEIGRGRNVQEHEGEGNAPQEQGTQSLREPRRLAFENARKAIEPTLTELSRKADLGERHRVPLGEALDEAASDKTDVSDAAAYLRAAYTDAEASGRNGADVISELTREAAEVVDALGRPKESGFLSKKRPPDVDTMLEAAAREISRRQEKEAHAKAQPIRDQSERGGGEPRAAGATELQGEEEPTREEQPPAERPQRPTDEGLPEERRGKEPRGGTEEAGAEPGEHPAPKRAEKEGGGPDSARDGEPEYAGVGEARPAPGSVGAMHAGEQLERGFAGNLGARVRAWWHGGKVIDEPGANFSKIDALKTKVSGYRLNALAKLSEEAARLGRFTAGAHGRAGVLTNMFRAAIQNDLRSLAEKDGHSNLNYEQDKFVRYLIDHNQRSLVDRWDEMAKDVRGMSDDELTKKIEGDAFETPLQALNTKAPFLIEHEISRGKRKGTKVKSPADLTGDLEALADDPGGARDFLAETFEKARDAAKNGLDPDFEGKKGTDYETTPEVGRMLKTYDDTLGQTFRRAHSLNEGDFRKVDHYFPLQAYEDLTAKKGFDPEFVGGPGVRSSPYKIGPNPRNFFATGLAESYDPSMKRFRSALAQALRKNGGAGFVKSLIDSGAGELWEPKTPGDTPPTSLTMDGEEVRAKSFPIGTDHLIDKNGQLKKIKGGARIVLPEQLAKEIAPILEPREFKEAVWRNVAQKLTTLALGGPTDATIHVANLFSTLVTMTPFISESAAGKTAELAGGHWAKGIITLAKLAAQDPTGADLPRLRELAENGSIPNSYGSHFVLTSDAKAAGAERGLFAVPGDRTASGKRIISPIDIRQFGSLIYDPKYGGDIRARLLIDKAGEQLAKTYGHEWTPEARFNWNRQLGNYVFDLEGDIERGAKGSGLAPFATAGMQGLRNGLRGMFGFQHLPLGEAGEGFKGQAFNRYRAALVWQTAVSGVVLWSLANKLYRDKWPWEEGAKLFQIKIRDDDRRPIKDDDSLGRKALKTAVHAIYGTSVTRPAYFNFGMPMNMQMRGLRASGLKATAEGLMAGRSAKSTGERAVVDSINAMAAPFLGPPIRFASVALMGREPYLERLSLGTQISPKFREADEKRPKTLLEAPLQNLVTAAANTNPIMRRLKETKEQDLPITRTAADAILPQLFKGPYPTTGRWADRHLSDAEEILRGYAADHPFGLAKPDEETRKRLDTVRDLQNQLAEGADRKEIVKQVAQLEKEGKIKPNDRAKILLGTLDSTTREMKESHAPIDVKMEAYEAGTRDEKKKWYPLLLKSYESSLKNQTPDGRALLIEKWKKINAEKRAMR